MNSGAIGHNIKFQKLNYSIPYVDSTQNDLNYASQGGCVIFPLNLYGIHCHTVIQDIRLMKFIPFNSDD